MPRKKIFTKCVAAVISVLMFVPHNCVLAADQITTDSRTATTLEVSGSTTDVRTSTVSGNTAFNSFSKFNVDTGNTVNLHLPNSTNNLINVVTGSQTNIDGILNSYKDGAIGGNVYFLNPYGVVVGANGVVNVGGFNAVTPTADFMSKVFGSDGATFDASLTTILENNVPVDDSGLISIQGKVYALEGVDLQAGNVDVSGLVRAAKAYVPGVDYAVPVNSTEALSADTVKIDGGKIMIVASDKVTLAGGQIDASGDNNDAIAAVAATATTPEVKAQAATAPGSVEISGETVELAGGVISAKASSGDSGAIFISSDNATISGDTTAAGNVTFDLADALNINDTKKFTVSDGTLEVFDIDVDELAELLGLDAEDFDELTELHTLSTKYFTLTIDTQDLVTKPSSSVSVGVGAALSATYGMDINAQTITIAAGAALESSGGSIILRAEYERSFLNQVLDNLNPVYEGFDETAKVTIGDGATIKAKDDVNITAYSTNIFELNADLITLDVDENGDPILSATDPLLQQILQGTTTSLQDLTTKFTETSLLDTFVTVAIIKTTAGIDIGNADITSTAGNIKVDATSKVDYLANNISFIVNGIYVENKATAYINIASGAAFTAQKDITVNADARNYTSIYQTNGGSLPMALVQLAVGKLKQMFSLSFTYQVCDSDADVNVAKDATFTANEGDVNVTAFSGAIYDTQLSADTVAYAHKRGIKDYYNLLKSKGKNNTVTGIAKKAELSGRVAAGIAYSELGSHADVYFDGTIVKAKDVNIKANSVMIDTGNYSTMAGSKFNGVTESLSEQIYKYNILQRKCVVPATSKFDLALNLAIIESENLASAIIGRHASITATGAVSLAAGAYERRAVTALAFAGDKVTIASTSPSGSKMPIAGSVIIEGRDNEAVAYIEDADDTGAAQINAASLAIDATAKIGVPEYYSVAETIEQATEIDFTPALEETEIINNAMTEDYSDDMVEFNEIMSQLFGEAFVNPSSYLQTASLSDAGEIVWDDVSTFWEDRLEQAGQMGTNALASLASSTGVTLATYEAWANAAGQILPAILDDAGNAYTPDSYTTSDGTVLDWTYDNLDTIKADAATALEWVSDPIEWCTDEAMLMARFLDENGLTYVANAATYNKVVTNPYKPATSLPGSSSSSSGTTAKLDAAVAVSVLDNTVKADAHIGKGAIINVTDKVDVNADSYWGAMDLTGKIITVPTQVVLQGSTKANVGGCAAFVGRFTENSAKAYIDSGANITVTTDNEADSVNITSKALSELYSYTTATGGGAEFGLDGAVAYTDFDTTSLAYIAGGAIVDTLTNVNVNAENVSRGALTVGSATGTKNIGVGASVNIMAIKSITKAYVGDDDDKADVDAGDINIGAKSSEKFALFTTAGVSQSSASSSSGSSSSSSDASGATGSSTAATQAAASKSSSSSKGYGVGISGSVGLNFSDSLTQAYIKNALLNSTGLVNVGADNVTYLSSASGSMAKNCDVGLAGAISYNDLTRNVNAFISGSLVDACGLSILTGTAEGGVDLIAMAGGMAMKTSSGSRSSGSSSSGSGAQFAGAATVNLVDNTSNAYLDEDNQITILGTSDLPGSVTIDADSILRLLSIAGSLAVGTKSKLSFGASVNVTDIDNTVQSFVDKNNILNADGDILINAYYREVILDTALSAAALSDIALTGVVSVKLIDNFVDAFIVDDDDDDGLYDTVVTAKDDLSVTSELSAESLTIDGGASFGKQAGIGLTNSTVVRNDNISAMIGSRVKAVAGNDDSDEDTIDSNGMNVSAKADNDMVIGVAGIGGSKGALGVSISAPITILTQNVIASIEDGAIINSKKSLTQVNKSTTAQRNQSVNVSAVNDTDLTIISGTVAAAKTAAIGAAAGVTLLNKETSAYIGSSADVDAINNITLNAAATENILQIVAGGGFGVSGAGIMGSASAVVLDLDTSSYIGSLANVDAYGNVSLAANDDTELGSIAGAIAGGSSVGISGGVTVTTGSKNVSAYVADNAVVNALGALAAITIASGRYTLSSSARDSDSLFSNDLESEDENGSSHTFNNQTFATAGTTTNSGLSITALSDTSIDEVGFAGSGSGTAAIAAAVSTDILDITTEAYLGKNVKVNAPDSGTLALGDTAGIYIAAGSNFSRMGIAGQLSISGSVAVGPAADVLVLNNKTRAFIDESSKVIAGNKGDVTVKATASEDIISIGAGLSGGVDVAVAGSAAAVVIDSTTEAFVGKNSTVTAGDDVVIAATDSTQVDTAAGSVAVGIMATGVAAAVGVVTLAKQTSAYVDDGASVTAKGLASESSELIAGTFGKGNGLSVLADSKEDIFNLAAGAGFGLVGVAGSVTVTLSDVDTLARIGENSVINSANNGSTASNVKVMARDDFDALTTANALAGGLVGVGAGVDVGIVKNNTIAYVDSNATVNSLGDIAFAALSDKKAQSWTFSAGVGATGIGAAISVYSIGNGFSGSVDSTATTYDDESTGGESENDTSEGGEENTDIDHQGIQDFVNAQFGGGTQSVEESGGDAQDTEMSGTNSYTSSMMGDAGAAIDNAGGDSTILEDKQEVLSNDAVDYAGDDVNSSSVSAADAASFDAFIEGNSGTLAAVGNNVTINAGKSFLLSSSDKNDFQLVAGGAAVGCVSVGAGIVVANLDSNSRAVVYNDAGDISSGTDMTVKAAAVNKLNGISGSGAFAYGAGISASVADININSLVQAIIGSNNVLDANGNLTVMADGSDNAMAQVLAVAVTWGGLSVGVGVADPTVNGRTEVSIGDNSELSGDDVTVVAQKLMSQAYADGAAGSAGALAGVGAGSSAKITDIVSVVTGTNVSISASDLVVKAVASPYSYARAVGASASVIGLGASIALAQNDITSYVAIGEDNDLDADTINIGAYQTLQSGKSDTACALAYAGTGSLLLSLNGVFAKAKTTGSTKATIASGTTADADSFTLVASGTNAQRALSYGISIAGIAAVGAAISKASSNTTDEAGTLNAASASDGVVINATDVNIKAFGNDTNYADITSGSGALYGAIGAAVGLTDTDNTTSAYLGDYSLVNPYSAGYDDGTFKLNAEHVSDFDAKMTSVSVAIGVAVNGSYIENDVYSRVLATMGLNSLVYSDNIEVLAENNVEKDTVSASGYNGIFGSGGLLTGNFGHSASDIILDTDVVINNGANLLQTGSLTDAGTYELLAENNITTRDRVKLISGGLIALTYVQSAIEAITAADITIGAANLISHGDMYLNAITNSNISTTAYESVYGLAAAACGATLSSLTAFNNVNLLSGAQAFSYGTAYLYTNKTSRGDALNNIYADTDLYNDTAFPVVSDPKAEAEFNLNNRITVGSGASVVALKDAYLWAEKGALGLSGEGYAEDLYTQALSAVANALGADVSFAKHTVASDDNAITGVVVDGEVIAGRNNKAIVDIDYVGGKLVVKKYRFDDGSNGTNYYLLGEGENKDGVVYDLFQVNLYTELMDERARYVSLKAQYASDADLVSKYQSEIDIIDLRLVGLDTTSLADYISFDGIKAASGDIKVTGDYLLGSGILKASFDTAITINNRSPYYLRLKDLIIDETSGGKIFFNMNTVTDNASLNSMQSDKPADLAKYAAEFNISANTSTDGTSTVEPVITINSETASSTKPDIEVTGTVRNVYGTVNISAEGSVVIKPENTKSYDMPILAKNINIVSGRNFIFSSPGFFHMSAPESLYSITAHTSSTSLSFTVNYNALTTPSIIRAYNNMYIAADYLNINGKLYSGTADRNLTLQTDVQGNVSLIDGAITYNLPSLAQIRTLTLSGAYNGDPIKILASSDDNISAYYDPVANKIYLDNIVAGGGCIMLQGQIMNTSEGGLAEINAFDGYQHVTVVNNTNYDLEVRNIDLSSEVEGKIKITDTGKKDASGNPMVSIYTRDASDNVWLETYYRGFDSTGNEVKLNDWSGAITDLYYQPLANQAYFWQQGYDATFIHTYGYEKSVWLGADWLDWAAPDPGSYDSHSVKDVRGPNGLGTGNYLDIVALSLDSGYGRKDYQTSWTEYGGERRSSHWSGWYKHFVSEQDYKQEMTYIWRFYKKASYPIKISFSGYDNGQVDITSKNNILLAGNILNPTGMVNITSQNGSIYQNKGEVFLRAKDISLNAATGINGVRGVVTDLVGGALDASSTTGNINLYEMSGDLNVRSITASAASAVVNVRASGSILSAATSDYRGSAYSGIIYGDKLNIVSDYASLGEAASRLLVNSISYINASAADSIYMAETTGNANVKSITAANDIYFTAVDGDIIDANDSELRDERAMAKLRGIWADLGLTESSKSESYRATLSSEASTMSNEYSTYWNYRSRQSDSSVYDADFAYTFSAAEKASLQQTYGWDSTKITSIEAQRTAEYHALNAKYGVYGNSRKTMDFVNVIEANANGELDSLVAAGKLSLDGAVWKASQLENRISSSVLEGSLGGAVIEDPNFKARNIHVKSSGKIGSYEGDVVIDFAAAKKSGLTDAEIDALSGAEKNDIVYIKDASGNVTGMKISVKEDVNFDFDGDNGSLTILAKGQVYGASQNDINIARIESGDQVRIYAAKGIFNVNTSLSRAAVDAYDVILEAATGAIGTEANPLTIKQVNGITARAMGDVNLRSFACDLLLRRVYSSSGTARLFTTGSVSDLEADDTAAISAENIIINADGSVGNSEVPVNIYLSSVLGTLDVTGDSNERAGDVYIDALGQLRVKHVASDGVVNLTAPLDIRIFSAFGGVDALTSATITAGGSILDADSDEAFSVKSPTITLTAGSENGNIGSLLDDADNYDYSAFEIDETGLGLTATAGGFINIRDVAGDLLAKSVESYNDEVILSAIAGDLYAGLVKALNGDVTLTALENITGVMEAVNVYTQSLYLNAGAAITNMVTSIDNVTGYADNGIELTEVDGLTVDHMNNKVDGDIDLLVSDGSLVAEDMKNNAGDINITVNDGNVDLVSIEDQLGDINVLAGLGDLAARSVVDHSGNIELTANSGKMDLFAVTAKNGNVTATTLDGDINVDSVSASDIVALTASDSITDMLADDSADVTGNLVNLIAHNGMISNEEDFLETVSGTLNAYGDSGVYLRELSGSGNSDMNLGVVEAASGKIYLKALEGSIIDSNDFAANLLNGDYLRLEALENIDTDMSSNGLVDAYAGSNIDIHAVTGNMNIFNILSDNGDIQLRALDNVLNRRDDRASVIIRGHDAMITADNVDVGEIDNPLRIDLTGDVSANAAGNVYIDELNSAMDVGTITSLNGNVILNAVDSDLNLGLISAVNGDVDLYSFDSTNDRDNDDWLGDFNNIICNDLHMRTQNGHIGLFENYIEIDTSVSREGELTAQAWSDIYLHETAGDMILSLLSDNTPGIYSYTGNIGLRAQRSIWDKDTADEYVNLWAKYIWLRAFDGQVGFADNLLVVDSHNRFSVRANLAMYVEERYGTMYSDYLQIDDYNGFLYLHIADADSTGGHGVVDYMYCMGDIDVDLHGVNNLWIGGFKKDDEFLPWEDHPETALTPSKLAKQLTGRTMVFSGVNMPMNISSLFNSVSSSRPNVSAPVSGPAVSAGTETMGFMPMGVSGGMITAPIFFYHGMDEDFMQFMEEKEKEKEKEQIESSEAAAGEQDETTFAVQQ